MGDPTSTADADAAKWREDLEKHPEVIRSVFDKIGTDEDTLAALQAMKFDDDDDPTGCALNYKTEGNKYFELKKYRWAVDNYSAGIARRCPDIVLNATLFANRGAAHFRLENYRSSLRDCQAAVHLNPEHKKAVLRGAECLMHLKRYGELVDWCREHEKVDQSDKLVNLKAEAAKLLKLAERDKRKGEISARKMEDKDKELRDALTLRGIKLNFPDVPLNEALTVNMPYGNGTTHVALQGGVLVWPVFFVYPEAEEFDLVSEFREDQNFTDHLAEMLVSSPPPWDTQRYYSDLTNLVLTYATDDGHVLFDSQSALSDILSRDGYVLSTGAPSFNVMSRVSPRFGEFCKKFGLTD